MANIFLISDTHFGHTNILKFIVHTPDCKLHSVELSEVDLTDLHATCGCPHMRDFSSVEEMDEFIVSRWNETVKPSDKVYHLGDVAMHKKCIETVGRCNGHKRLVRGNHDIHPDKYYTPFFESIYGTRVFDDLILSHIPLHPESLRAGWTNVHGHVHNNVPANHFGTRYHNISVEVTDYRPLAIEEVRQRIVAQKAENQRLIDMNLARLGVKKLWTNEELYFALSSGLES